MFCSQCGKPIPDNSQFCYQCGANLSEIENIGAAPSPAQRSFVTAPPLQAQYAPPQSQHVPPKNQSGKMSSEEYQQYKTNRLAAFKNTYQSKMVFVLASPIILVLAIYMSYLCLDQYLPLLGDVLNTLSIASFETTLLIASTLLQIGSVTVYAVGLWLTFCCGLNKNNICTNGALIGGLRCVQVGAYLMVASQVLLLFTILFEILQILIILDSVFWYILAIFVFLGLQISTRVCIGRVTSSLINNLPCASANAEPAKPLGILSGILGVCYLLLFLDIGDLFGPFAQLVSELEETLMMNAAMYLLICVLAFIYYNTSSKLEYENAAMYRELDAMKQNVVSAKNPSHAWANTPHPAAQSSHSTGDIPAWKLAEMRRNNQQE